LEGAGYAVGAADLCAAGVGAPHIRQRLYWVANADVSANERGQSQPSERAVEKGDDGLCRRAYSSTGGLGIDGSAPGNAGHAPQRDPTCRQRHPEASDDDFCGSCGKYWDYCDCVLPGLPRRAEAEDGANEARGQDAPGNVSGILESATAAEACPSGGLANSECNGVGAGRGREAVEGRAITERSAQQSDRLCDDSRMANPNGGKPSYRDVQRGRRLVQLTQDPLAGFWRGSDWLACTDGKARPVEPGTFPLAHGYTGRVGQLRAYGNSLCEAVAQEFVEAVMECLP
jgi:DNA (cytosine-5)-methyltransferase 1